MLTEQKLTVLTILTRDFVQSPRYSQIRFGEKSHGKLIVIFWLPRQTFVPGTVKIVPGNSPRWRNRYLKWLFHLFRWRIYRYEKSGESSKSTIVPIFGGTCRNFWRITENKSLEFTENDFVTSCRGISWRRIAEFVICRWLFSRTSPIWRKTWSPSADFHDFHESSSLWKGNFNVIQ